MKLLFVSEYFPPQNMGGGEINLHLLAKKLVKDGVEVSVLTSYFQGLERFEEMDGIRVYRTLITGEDPSSLKSNITRSLDFPKYVVKEVKKITRKQHFDIIHFIGTSILAAEKLSSLKIPLFATVESYPSLCPKGDRIFHGKKECKIKCSFTKFIVCQAKSKEIGKMENKAYLKYNLPFLIYLFNYHKKLQRSLNYCNNIAISGYISKILKQHGIKSKVIPNALEPKKFIHLGKKINKKKNTKEKKIKILYLGSLTKYKGPQIILKAVKDLPVRCQFYGDGPLKEELKTEIKENDLDAEINDFVPYEKIPEIYANTDIVVFPSIWPEPFGRIAIEGMAAGKPVIGSEIGGIKETLDNGRGILVRPGNVSDLKKAIVKLVNDKKLREDLGMKGKNIVKNNYTEEKIIKQLINFYQHPLII